MSIWSRSVTLAETGRVANLCAQFLPFLAFFFCAPVLALVLGIDRFGTLMLLTIVPQIAGQLHFGVAATGTRLLARYGAFHQTAFERRVFIESLLALAIIGLIISVALILLTGPLIAVLHLAASLGSLEQAKASIEATALWAFMGLFGLGAALVFRARQQYRFLAFVQASSGVAFWVGAVVFASAGVGVVGILLWGSVTGFASAIFLLGYSRTWLAGGGPMPSTCLLPLVWRYSAGAFTAQFSSLLTYHLDKLLVGALVSPAAAGLYTACANTASKLLALVAAVSTFSFPQSTVMHSSGDVAGIQRIFVEGTRINLSLALALGVPAIALSEPFLRFWLGESASNDFSTGFSILVLGYFFATTSVVAANVASGTGDSRTPALFALTGGCLTLLLCALLTPKYGLIGAATASMIGMSQAIVFCVVIAKRLGDDNIHKLARQLWPALIVSLIVGAALRWGCFLVDSWWSLLAFAGLSAILIASMGMLGSTETLIRLRCPQK